MVCPKSSKNASRCVVTRRMITKAREDMRLQRAARTMTVTLWGRSADDYSLHEAAVEML
jgi:hypothetical protein